MLYARKSVQPPVHGELHAGETTVSYEGHREAGLYYTVKYCHDHKCTESGGSAEPGAEEGRPNMFRTSSRTQCISTLRRIENQWTRSLMIGILGSVYNPTVLDPESQLCHPCPLGFRKVCKTRPGSTRTTEKRKGMRR